jgi:hypothetical protein
MEWHPNLPCEICGNPVRWFGEWNPPRGNPDEGATPYEVKFVARFDDYGEWGDTYFPYILVCRNERDETLELWPRYHRIVAGRRRFGQDGPRLPRKQWQDLFDKVDAFLRQQTPA